MSNGARSSLSYIEAEDGRFLSVWSKRVSGWSMPGGGVEDGESLEAAQRRELAEETGLLTRRAELIYHNSWNEHSVYVFRVTPEPHQTPREAEAGCPAVWLTRDEYLRSSPYASFARRMFASVPMGQPTYLP